jgi:hypothetical protein
MTMCVVPQFVQAARCHRKDTATRKYWGVDRRRKRAQPLGPSCGQFPIPSPHQRLAGVGNHFALLIFIFLDLDLGCEGRTQVQIQVWKKVEFLALFSFVQGIK